LGSTPRNINMSNKNDNKNEKSVFEMIDCYNIRFNFTIQFVV